VLVLARKPNQSIMIGDDIEIKIIEVKGDQIKIGIQAPKNIAVHRKEVYEEIKKANIEATKSNKTPSTFRKIAGILKKNKVEDKEWSPFKNKR